jgi:tetratricopeptide (TPR) repeat protein
MSDDRSKPADTDFLLQLRQKVEEANASDHPAAVVELLSEYMKLDRDDVRFRYICGDNLRSVGRPQEALAVFNDIDLAHVPEPRRYLIDLSVAQIYDDLGQFQPAEDRYRRAIQLRPDSTVPWIFLAGFLARRGRVKEAADVLRNAVAASGDLDEVHENLGNYARALGDYDIAKEHYLKSLDLSPGDPDVTRALDDVVAASEARRWLATHSGQTG